GLIPPLRFSGRRLAVCECQICNASWANSSGGAGISEANSDGTVDAIRRLFPYIWPQKRRLAWSVIFGVLVAAFWGMDLLAAKPLLDILTVGSPHQSIPKQIAEAAKEIDERTANIAE